MEAVSYCREHHVDLVSVTSEELQRRVAREARSATSPYVWLGLRYTCKFHFWFWVGSDGGGDDCYEDWAPGHGPEGGEEEGLQLQQQLCGGGTTPAGAVEATGGQQWVSLDETERHNFICLTC